MWLMRRSVSSLSKIAHWSYVVYAASAALVAAVKGFFYAHLMDEIQYASLNYYLLLLGLGVLLVSSGVVVRCHTEIPLLVKRGDGGLEEFVGAVKNTGFACWIVLCVVLLASQGLTDLDGCIQVLSVFQILIFFLFTVDLMCIKGRLDFTGYAKSLFLRNAIIASAGFVSAYITADATKTVLAEVVCAVVIYFRGLISFIIGLRLPALSFFRRSLGFMPVTLVGAFLQFADRSLASSLLEVQDFSRYSYFSLVVMAGLSLQQLINTRVITVLPGICEKDTVCGFYYVVKVSAVVAVLLCGLLSVGMYFLQSPWFSAGWVKQDYYVGSLFVLIGLVRSVDFYSSYLLVMGRKGLLFLIQLGVLMYFVVLFLYFYWAGGVSLSLFLTLVFLGFMALLFVLVFVAWGVRHAIKVEN